MSTLNGLPAHILLNHAIVVLAPLTALLAVLCALWPAARRRVVWLVLALAVLTFGLTPLTVNAGGYLADEAASSPALEAHMSLGDTAIYYSAALVAVAVLLAVGHVLAQRGRAVRPVAQGLLAAVVIAASATVVVQVYRVGESGARAVWGGCPCGSE